MCDAFVKMFESCLKVERSRADVGELFVKVGISDHASGGRFSEGESAALDFGTGLLDSVHPCLVKIRQDHCMNGICQFTCAARAGLHGIEPAT